MIYLTSDTHWGHKKILEYCSRPFSSIGEMDEKLIENWNKVVSSKDTVYHLGDFGFGKYEMLLSIFKRLKGQIIICKGNHDTEAIKLPWVSKHDLYELKANGNVYQLCHYPLRSWNKSVHGSRMCHGHCHGTLSPLGYSCDVGVDCWDFAPVSLEQLEELFKKLSRDGKGTPMPKGTIWNAKRHMDYGFSDFFIGDGSLDKVDPDELFEKEIK